MATDDVLSELSKEEFDYVIVGTGLTNSILSGALSAVGKKVLHIDENEWYGADEATLTPTQLVQENAKVLNQEKWGELMEDRLVERQFNIDLDPRLVLCRGGMVDALVRSGVARYLEFKALEDALILNNDCLIRVPCSKAAVFKSQDISMGEKRQLMKFLQYCVDAGTSDVKFRNETSLNQGRSLARPQSKKEKGYGSTEQEEGSFEEFLERKCKLSPKLRNCVLYAVALLPSEPENEFSLQQGMKEVQLYLGGLGRYGSTAFLCPVYGVSEVGQAFCRLSSVLGSVFILRHSIETISLTTANSTVDTVKFNQSESLIRAKCVIAPASNNSLPVKVEGGFSSQTGHVVRKVAIANGPLLSLAASTGATPDGKLAQLVRSSAVAGHPSNKRVFAEEGRCFLVIPPNHPSICNETTIYILQLENGVEAGAPGYFTIHLSAENIELDCLDRAMAMLLERATMRFQAVFASETEEQGQEEQDELEGQEEAKKKQQKGRMGDLENIFEYSFKRPMYVSEAKYFLNDTLVAVPDVRIGLSMQSHIDLAKCIFTRLLPKEEFLPSEPKHKTAQYGDQDDDPTSFINRVKVPQPVDLTWFAFLQGKVVKS